MGPVHPGYHVVKWTSPFWPVFIFVQFVFICSCCILCIRGKCNDDASEDETRGLIGEDGRDPGYWSKRLGGLPVPRWTALVFGVVMWSSAIIVHNATKNGLGLIYNYDPNRPVSRSVGNFILI